MIDESDESFWVKMSILEIRAQATFAEMAYRNIDRKAHIVNEWIVFSSIHSFLSHCAMISKMLRAKGATKTIEKILGLPLKSIIHDREFRNHLEHYDERLKKWIRKAGVGASVINHCIGDKTMISGDNIVFVSFYNPMNKIFTFIDEEFNLELMFAEVQKIKNKTEKWLNKNGFPTIEARSGSVGLP